MGRKNKRIARAIQSKQNTRILSSKPEPTIDFSSLDSSQQRIEIAHICATILSCPELHVFLTQIRKAAELISLVYYATDEIAGLALASICAVFEDIIPEYVVKKHTEETKMSISKEVKALRMYEGLLLKQYENYVKVLVEEMEAGRVIALRCACRLLSKHPHFNLTDELLKAVTKYVGLDPTQVAEALRRIILSNNLPQRYKALRAVNKILRSISYKHIPSSLLTSLEQIDFTVLSAPKPSRKRSRTEAQLDHDLELAGEENESNLATANRRDLGEVLGIYLLVFRRFMDSHLLSPVLKGLIKLVPVTNVEMVWALLRELLQVVEKGELPALRILECAESCLTIMKQCGETIQLEDRVLTGAVYTCLTVTPVDMEKQELLVKCLSCLLLEKRIVAKEVLGSFMKRLLQLAPHYEPPLMRTFVYIVKSLVAKFPKARALLDEEEGEDCKATAAPVDPYTCDSASLSFRREMELLRGVTSDPEVHKLLRDLHKVKPEGTQLTPQTYFTTQVQSYRRTHF